MDSSIKAALARVPHRVLLVLVTVIQKMIVKGHKSASNALIVLPLRYQDVQALHRTTGRIFVSTGTQILAIIALRKKPALSAITVVVESNTNVAGLVTTVTQQGWQLLSLWILGTTQ